MDGDQTMVVSDQRLAALLQYWRNLKSNGRLPSRRTLDLAAIPSDLVPHFFVYDVSRDPLDYRMRLAGSMLCATVGYEMRGRTFDEIHPADQAAAIREEFDRVVRSGRPHYAERSAQWLPDRELAYRRLLLPFAEDGVTVDSLAGASLFELEQAPLF